MPKKVYIVDDDKDIVDVLTLVLTSKGYEVIASYSAKEAVERAQKEKPDLIVLDIMFPEDPSEGFKVARELRSDKMLAKIPVLVLSAVNEEYHLGFSNKLIDDSWLPVNEFLEKPVEPDEFIAIVEKLIGK